MLAGYRGDIDRALVQMKRCFAPAEYDFIGQTYPDNWRKQHGYVKAVGTRIVNYIFGENGAANFCRSQDRSCAVDEIELKRHKNERCQLARDAACHRARPGMLAFIANSPVFEELFAKFGRAALILRYDAETLADADALSAFIDTHRHIIDKARDFLANLRNNVLAPRLPKENFQVLANRPIARDVQADLSRLAEIMNRYHSELYDSAFQNPRRGGARGAYMFDENIRFQRDKLHKSAQIGQRSRTDIFHLINTYHLYGLAIDPGFHFDVMRVDGEGLKKIFRDVLDGKSSSPSDTHVNISPCDRLL